MGAFVQSIKFLHLDCVKDSLFYLLRVKVNNGNNLKITSVVAFCQSDNTFCFCTFGKDAKYMRIKNEEVPDYIKVAVKDFCNDLAKEALET